MSSILKALQKVENRDPEEGYILTWRLRQSRAGSLSLRIKILKIVGQISAAALAAAFLVAAGWFVLTRNPDLANTLLPGLIAVEQNRPAHTERLTGAGERSADFNRVSEPKPEQSPVSDSPPTAQVQKEILQNADTIIERDIDGDSMSPPAEMNIGPPMDGKDMKVAPVPAEEGSKTPPAPEAFTDDGEIADAARLNDGAPAALKLQALAWSNDPDKRVALINDIVVKKGRYVKGYKVTHIGKDSVIVQSGGAKWTLRFESE